MDVIVDSCVVMANPTMRGRYFQDLFDYLRRTDSRLIILPIVFDEVLVRYEEKLSERLKEALDVTKALNGTTLVNVAPAIDMDIAQETRRYKGFLTSGLREGVPLPLRVLSDYSTIDVKEVAVRGITRKPPSNSAGEELRDVMVWLAAQAFCRQSKNPVAFISDDGAFWRKAKPRGLKPELLEELTKGNVQMQVYWSINDFLKATAVKAIDVPKSWFAAHVSLQAINSILLKYRHSMIYGLWHGLRSVDLQSSTIEFNSGKLYDLGRGAQLAETGIACELSLRVSDWGYALAEESLLGSIVREEMPKEQQILYTHEYRLKTMLFISLRLQNDKVTDVVPERFEYDPPPPGTEIVSPPVFLRPSYS